MQKVFDDIIFDGKIVGPFKTVKMTLKESYNLGAVGFLEPQTKILKNEKKVRFKFNKGSYIINLDSVLSIELLDDAYFYFNLDEHSKLLEDLSYQININSEIRTLDKMIEKEEKQLKK